MYGIFTSLSNSKPSGDELKENAGGVVFSDWSPGGLTLFVNRRESGP